MKALIIIFTVLLFATTKFTDAQNTSPTNTHPTVKDFGDIVEVNFDQIGAGQTPSMEIRNVLLFLCRNHFSLGVGVGLQATYNSSVALPISCDIRYYFNPAQAATPFLNFYSGFNFNNFPGMIDNKNIVFLGLNIGVNIVETHHINLQLAIGCKLEHYGYFNLQDITSNYAPTYLSMPFTIGAVF